MLTAFLFSFALLGLSGLLIDSHRRTWQHVREDRKLPEAAKQFGRSQFRRRMQASGMIGLIGFAIGIGPLVPRRPGPMAFYLATLVAACAWIMLLAMIDLWAGRRHLRRLRGELTTAQQELAAQLRPGRDTTEAEA